MTEQEKIRREKLEELKKLVTTGMLFRLLHIKFSIF